MGGIQSKKDFIKRNEERISQLEHSMKVLDDNLKSTNTEENNIYREGISQFPDRREETERARYVKKVFTKTNCCFQACESNSWDVYSSIR